MSHEPSRPAQHHGVGRIRELAATVFAPMWLWPCTFVGARVRTLGRPRILNHGRMELGDDVVIDSRFSRTELVSAANGRIVIGNRTAIDHGAMIVASRFVEIGEGTTLGAYCIVSDSDDPDLAAGAARDGAKPIWIGDEVVIGARVTVLPGARVGARSHILAGSIVAGEIAPGVVAGGNPARPLRKLRPHTASASMPASLQVPAVVAVTADVGPGGSR